MLSNAELQVIKEELKTEILVELRRQLSAELTGAAGRILKKLERQQSLQK